MNLARRLSPPLLAATLVAAPLLAHAQAPAQVAAQAPAAATLPEVQPQNGQRFPVGKWPEGVVVAGGSTWVAESGARSVGQFDAAGVRQKTIKIGRLPVSMAVGPDGAVWVQVTTDEVLKRIDPQTGKVTTGAKFPDGPEGMAVEGEHAFVLLWKDHSSAGSSVLRVPLVKGKAAGKAKRSADLGPNAFGLAVCGGQVWVAQNEGQLVQVDGESLAVKATVQASGRLFNVACAGEAVYGAGEGRVVRVAAGQVSHSVELPARVAALGAWEDLVAAATEEGTLWILDPATLAVRHRLAASAPFRARGITRDGSVMWITAHDGGDEAALLRVDLK